MSNRKRRFSLRVIGLMACFALGWTAVSVSAVDRVIFRDGFYLDGTMFKEKDRITDSENGFSFNVPKAKGFDVLDDGLRWWIFSKHQKQAAEVKQNIKGLEEIKEYERDVRLRQTQSLPTYGQFSAPQFDKNWKRTIKVMTNARNYQNVEQVIRVLGPKRMIIVSPTHRWYPYFSTRELSPATIRSLLVTHPELDEKGKPDPSKRLAIAKFFYQGDFLDAAKAEIALAKKEIPGPWTAAQTELLDQLQAKIDAAEAKLIVDEMEVAKSAGRYNSGLNLTKMFDAKAATAELTNRYAKLKAELEIIQPVYEKTKRFLTADIEELSRQTVAAPGAIGGGMAAFAARIQLPAQTQKLITACEAVRAELHPDNAERVDIYRKLSEDAERLKKLGNPATSRTPELLALAISGWVMGPNGADNNVANALRLWDWRETLMLYQNTDILNNRRALFNKMQRSGPPVTADVLSQMIRYLPPTNPENLAEPSGVPIPANERTVPGIYQYNSGPVDELAAGIDYLVRLPSEYHHGREYPVVIALTHLSIPAEQMVSLLAYEADRNGFIIAAPLWTNAFDEPYDWSGDQHYKVRATLRSLIRRFRVDNNRVSLFGFGEGADFALDVGASHPDLFAGMVAMGSNPKWPNHFMYYWRNCQKLPVYVASGALAGAGLDNIRSIFENWMPKGFPAIASVYRGRGLEWFGGDLTYIFEWLRTKKRATGTSVLRLGQFGVEPWSIMRKTDNRFYWVGSENINPNNLIIGKRSGVPAEITADIFQGNEIKISSRGLKTVTIWLDREMIDWSKPVSIRINSAVPQGYRPQVLEQDLDLMLEQFYEHGDRSLLFLQKLELIPN